MPLSPEEKKNVARYILQMRAHLSIAEELLRDAPDNTAGMAQRFDDLADLAHKAYAESLATVPT